jgi:hypothetical protein
MFTETPTVHEWGDNSSDDSGHGSHRQGYERQWVYGGNKRGKKRPKASANVHCIVLCRHNLNSRVREAY